MVSVIKIVTMNRNRTIIPLLQYNLILFLLVLATDTLAQTGGIWNNINHGRKAAEKKIRGTGKQLKEFKVHLEKWGLDSNYNHGLSIGVRSNSSGWTGLISYQHRINRIQSHFLQLSFSEIIHEKQIKQQRQNSTYPYLGSSSPFIFGKINKAYQVQLGYGREYLLLPGVLEGNLSVSLRCQSGVSLALMKPYYLKLIYVNYTPDEHAYVLEEKYSETNQDHFLNAGGILGAAKWKQGLREMKYIPGAYLDASIAIEPIKNKTFIKVVSLGANLSVQSKQLEIMADQKAYPWTLCLYAGLSIGKRWK